MNQGILSLNPRQTYELLKANGLVEGLDDGWNKKWTVCLQHGGRVPTLLEAVENGTAVRG